jgi:hypothetical protein
VIPLHHRKITEHPHSPKGNTLFTTNILNMQIDVKPVLKKAVTRLTDYGFFTVGLFGA